MVWLGLGGLLYAALFSDRAETYDAFEEARDPLLARMRGRNPLVLVPVANPHTAQGMVEVAAALAPPRVGRVILLQVMPSAQGQSLPALSGAQLVMAQALSAAMAAGHRPEGLVTIAEQPWREIARVVRSHGCAGLVVGVPRDLDRLIDGPLEMLLNDLDCDVTVVRCDDGWSPRTVQRVLVPVGRKGYDVEMRARVLGSLQTASRPQITWVTVIEPGATAAQEADSRRLLLQIARDNVYGDPMLTVVRHADPVEAIAKLAAAHDLLVLGMHRNDDGKRRFGEFNASLAQRTTVATLMIAGR